MTDDTFEPRRFNIDGKPIKKLDRERPAEERAQLLAEHKRRIAELELVEERLPFYATRDQLRDPAFYAEHKHDIEIAMREGRILPAGAELPPDARITGPVGPPPTFRRSELRDQAFYHKHEAEIRAAQREGRIVDDTHQLINRGGTKP